MIVVSINFGLSSKTIQMNREFDLLVDSVIRAMQPLREELAESIGKKTSTRTDISGFSYEVMLELEIENPSDAKIREWLERNIDTSIPGFRQMINPKEAARMILYREGI